MDGVPSVVGRCGWALLALGLVVVLVAGVGYAAVRTRPPTLAAHGPTEVSGTAASAVFSIAGREIRQVRYRDRATLHYGFRLTNGRRAARHRDRDRPAPAQRPAVPLRRTGGAGGRAAVHGARPRFPRGEPAAPHGWLREPLRPRRQLRRHCPRCAPSGWGSRPALSWCDLPEEVHTGSPTGGVLPELDREVEAARLTHGYVRFPLETVGGTSETGAHGA